MKKRSTEIIQEIIRTNHEVHLLKDFADQYGVSKKTLRNDIKEINEFLRTIPMPELELTAGGEIKVPSGFDRTRVELSVYEMSPYLYKLSTEERQIYIMMMLTIGSRHTSMQKYADDLFVSRVTIVNDIETIKEDFKKFGAELVTDPGKGMLLECSEKIKTTILMELYRKISINIRNNGYFQKMMLNQMNIRYSFSDVFSYLQEYLRLNSIMIIEDVLYDITLYIFVVFNFSHKDGKLLQRDTELDQFGQMLSYVGLMLEVSVTQNIMSDFAEYIVERNLHTFVKSVDEVQLCNIIIQFLRKFDSELGFEISADPKLLESLLLHIENMKDWGDFEIELPTDSDVYIDYDFLQELVNEHAPILEKYLAYKLSDNMKRSIVIHICVSLIRNQRHMPRYSVVIVCPGSMATGKYLESQIRNYFDFHIIGTYSASKVVRELKKRNLDVDFIISTVSLPTSEYEVIRVHSFLTIEDMNLIQKKTFEKRKVNGNHQNAMIARLRTMIHDEVDDPELAEKLCSTMIKVIQEYNAGSNEDHFNEIAELLTLEDIRIENRTMLWSHAIEQAGQILLQKGCVTQGYIDRAIQNVREYGDYIIVSPGVALAHADKDAGVEQDGLSLLVDKSGIIFEESNEKVHLLFFFASQGKKDYLKLLKTIMRTGSVEGRVKSICKLDTKEEIYNYIIHMNQR